MTESRNLGAGALGYPGKSDRSHRHWDGRRASESEPLGAQKGIGPKLRVRDGRGQRRRACFPGLGYLEGEYGGGEGRKRN